MRAAISIWILLMSVAGMACEQEELGALAGVAESGIGEFLEAGDGKAKTLKEIYSGVHAHGKALGCSKKQIDGVWTEQLHETDKGNLFVRLQLASPKTFASKVRDLLKFGLFTHAMDEGEALVHCALKSLNAAVLAAAIKRDSQVVKVISTLVDPPESKLKTKSLRAVTHRNIGIWMRESYLQILPVLAENGFVDVADDLIKSLLGFDIPIFQAMDNERSGVHVKKYSPVLAMILGEMHSRRASLDKL